MVIQLPNTWKPRTSKINACQFLFHTWHLGILSGELNMLLLIDKSVYLTIHKFETKVIIN